MTKILIGPGVARARAFRRALRRFTALTLAAFVPFVMSPIPAIGAPAATESRADPADDLLDPDVAFKATAKLVGSDRIEVRYETAPGYYLYRDRLSFAIEPSSARLGKPKLPPGKVKADEFFGRQVVYRNRTVVSLPVRWDRNGPLTLTADLQGCADLGVCYPPVRRTFTLAP